VENVLSGTVCIGFCMLLYQVPLQVSLPQEETRRKWQELEVAQKGRKQTITASQPTNYGFGRIADRESRTYAATYQ